MIVLDTSAIIELNLGTEKGKKIARFIEKEATAISAISVNEFLIGAKNKKLLDEFVKTTHILPFDAEAAYKSVEIEEKLKGKGKMINKLDILIAATVLVHGLQLITADKDFMNIEELKVITV